MSGIWNSSELLEVASGRLAIHRAGNGPPVLLVHAYPLSHELWSRLVRDWSGPSVEWIAPDLFGFGGSSKPATPDARSMRTYADDLASVLDGLAITQPVVYVGVSMAGYIGWQFVRHHRERLAGLFLACTKAAGDSPDFAAKRENAATKVLSEGIGAMRGTARTLLGRTTRQRHPELETWLGDLIRETAPVGIAAAQRGMAQREDVRDWLPTLDCPTCFVAGEEDTFSPPEEMKGWVETIPQSEFHVVESSGHLPMLEQPAVFASHLSSFLERTLGSSGRSSD